jgi:thiamine pyrophosphate-dependent acetolactate synthase large subunit-like protein
MAQTVADTLVGVPERIGVKQIFALIGDSLNPLADSPRSSSIEWIGVRHEAARDHAPVLALSGNMPRKLQGVDYIQTTNPDLLFRDVSLYTESINSPEQAPAVIHQAIAAAYVGRGVAHLTLPQDVILAETNCGVASMDTLRRIGSARHDRSRKSGLEARPGKIGGRRPNRGS